MCLPATPQRSASWPFSPFLKYVIKNIVSEDDKIRIRNFLHIFISPNSHIFVYRKYRKWINLFFRFMRKLLNIKLSNFFTKQNLY